MPAALPAWIAPHPAGWVLRLVIVPRAGQTAIAGVDGEALRVRVAAPPVEGAANAELLRFLARQTGTPKSSVRLLSGGTGRRKRVLISGSDAGEVVGRLVGSLGDAG